MVSQVVVNLRDPGMQMGFVFPLFWMETKKPFADLGNPLWRIIIIWNHANTDVRTFIFPRVFIDSARKFTRPSSGASHGQPSYRECTQSRNADGACFSTPFEGNRETVCGIGNPFAVLIRPLCRNTDIFHIFYGSPEGYRSALGDCGIWRYHFIRP